MTTIKAPFNFVPLSDRVYFPDWADDISHDIPFKDGKSGAIEIKIKANSPIFVRNGHTKEDAKQISQTYQSFSKIGDCYFLPATTIKGVIRNVLEIMSFGKMTQVDNDSFGLRDLSNSTDGKHYRSIMKQQQCGWLQLVNNEYKLTDCGVPGRISLSAIDEKFKTELYPFVKDSNNFKKDAGRTAKAKYDVVHSKGVLSGSFEIDKELTTTMTKKNPVDKRLFVKFGGTKKGTLVLTGQPGERKKIKDRITNKEKWTGKFYEFVFFDEVVRTITLKEDSKIIQAFKTVHKNSPDYVELWASKLQKGEKIPVFFQYEGKELHSIGLSYLYKFPTKKTVYDAIPNELKNLPDAKERLDLTEVILGCTYNESLKGRVQFRHAMSISNSCLEIGPVKTVSSTPHPSYYPLYLGLYNGNYQNWNNAIRIAGRKRYPIRRKLLKNNSGTDGMASSMILLDKGTLFNTPVPNMATSRPMILLDKGTLFNSKISFHNLRPIEIGALLSAITFHKTQGCLHNIGYGKPFGYGSVDMEAKLTGDLVGKEHEYLDLFEREMDIFLKNTKWKDTVQFKELISMAKGIPDEKLNEFEYMIMLTNQSDNQFKEGKHLYDKGTEYLRSFTSILNGDSYLKGNTSTLANRPRTTSHKFKSVKNQEEEYGWIIEMEEEHHAYIKSNHMISICNPDRNAGSKNIVCKYEIDIHLSKIKKADPDEAVKISVLEKEGSKVFITIDRIVKPKKR